MPTAREQLIDQAKDAIKRGASLRAAAKDHNIPPSTLCDRLHKSQPIKVAKISAQKLSPAQERFVADWAKAQEAVGRPRTKIQVRSFASQILIEAGATEGVSIRWIDRFLKRHPDVKTKKTTKLESKRAAGSTRKAYEKFYRILREQCAQKKITSPLLTNMDEHGIQEIETNGGTVIGDSLTSKAFQITSNNTTWVSVIEAGTADGRRLTPVVIFTGTSL